MTQKNGYDTLDKTECKDIGEGGRGKDEGEGSGGMRKSLFSTQFMDPNVHQCKFVSVQVHTQLHGLHTHLYIHSYPIYLSTNKRTALTS